jgi:hypothetical protein
VDLTRMLRVDHTQKQISDPTGDRQFRRIRLGQRNKGHELKLSD